MKTFKQLRNTITEKFVDIDSLRHAKVEEKPVENYKGGEQSKNLKPLPKSLSEAINLTKKSSLVKETLGNHAFSYFIQNKEFEYNQYRTQITDYEIKHYLPIL